MLPQKEPKKLPPSSPSIPILGHLQLMKLFLHQVLYSLSQSYGPIFSLHFASCQVVIVSSAKVAEECCTNYDIVLANSPSTVAGGNSGYDDRILVFASYGEQWRNICRFCTLEIFSSARLNSFLPIRRDEIKRLLLNRNKEPQPHHLATTSLRMLTGKRYFGEDVTKADEATVLREVMSEIIEYVVSAYPGDYLSILRLVLRNYEKKCLS
ncbi:cytochrome P450 81Q32-like [Eucalyptus grandis]|uniref:cytochrome P450 81Q32-like n=1 Tax=Eucalyptus grandis TaxID=71139 RepID=UPI00192E8EEB|nr:cytochrome P450 81Q32-like [Eucalyptus grandis]